MSRYRIERVAFPESAQSQVYRRLKQAILDAQFRPGEILSIRVLAAEFGTSTMPVREAATRLVSERGLELLPNRGLRVPRLSRRRAEEIFSIRVVLEGMAAAMAAENAQPKDLVTLATIENQLEDAMRQQDLKLALQLNTRFHFELYRMANCETLLPLIESLYLQYAPTLSIVLDVVDTAEARVDLVHSAHSAILAALHARDAVAARKATETDITEIASMKTFLAALPDD